MSSNSWWQTLTSAQVAGPTLTAAAAATCIPAANKFIFPGGLLKIGDKLRVKATGIISCVVTTPGTARFDYRIGGAVVFDSGALNLNIVAKTNVPWTLDIDMVVRSIGTAATIWGQGTWSSEAVIASPLPSVGGNGVLNIPVSSVAVGASFDSTGAVTAMSMDMFFTQTVGTGSLTLQTYELSLNT